MVAIWIEYPPSYVCAVDLMKFPEVMTTWQIYLVDLSKNWKTLIEFVSRHISSLIRQKIAEFHVFFLGNFSISYSLDLSWFPSRSLLEDKVLVTTTTGYN